MMDNHGESYNNTARISRTRHVGAASTTNLSMLIIIMIGMNHAVRLNVVLALRRRAGFLARPFRHAARKSDKGSPAELRANSHQELSRSSL